MRNSKFMQRLLLTFMCAITVFVSVVVVLAVMIIGVSAAAMLTEEGRVVGIDRVCVYLSLAVMTVMAVCVVLAEGKMFSLCDRLRSQSTLRRMNLRSMRVIAMLALFCAVMFILLNLLIFAVFYMKTMSATMIAFCLAMMLVFSAACLCLGMGYHYGKILR